MLVQARGLLQDEVFLDWVVLQLAIPDSQDGVILRRLHLLKPEGTKMRAAFKSASLPPRNLVACS